MRFKQSWEVPCSSDLKSAVTGPQAVHPLHSEVSNCNLGAPIYNPRLVSCLSFYNTVCFISWVVRFSRPQWLDNLQGLKKIPRLTSYSAGQLTGSNWCTHGRHVVRAPGRSEPRSEACSAFWSLKPEQDFLHFNFPNSWLLLCFV